MSWIQENRFAAGLGGVTAIAAIGLIVWGVKAGGAYNQAKEEYTTAADEVDGMAKGKLFPQDDLLQAKKKAVADYQKATDDLQAAFTKFRAATPANVEPPVFSESLLKAKEAAAASFEAIRPEPTVVPSEFFLGFESYTNEPAKKEATGILTYQLGAISELVANLAKAAPTRLINISRPPLAEEGSQTFDAKGKTYRALPVEISFAGTEDSVRKFVSSLDDSESHYYVIRSMRLINEKTKAPTAADGVFESTEEAAGADAGAGAGAGADPFGGAGAFVLPGDEAAAPADGAEAAPADAAPAPDAAAGGTGVILQQVLGSEKVNAFFRIDIIQFLEAPKP